MVDVETVTAEKQRNLAFGKDGDRGWFEKNDMKELCFTPNKVRLLLEGGGLLVMCTPWSHGIGHFSFAKTKECSVAWLLDGGKLCLLLGSRISLPFFTWSRACVQFTI